MVPIPAPTATPGSVSETYWCKAPGLKTALGKLCTGGCAERLAESGHENRVQRMEVEMTDPAMSATETACCPRFPHSAHLAPAGSSCLRT
jgi:hypothetical protein